MWSTRSQPMPRDRTTSQNLWRASSRRRSSSSSWPTSSARIWMCLGIVVLFLFTTCWTVPPTRSSSTRRSSSRNSGVSPWWRWPKWIPWAPWRWWKYWTTCWRKILCCQGTSSWRSKCSGPTSSGYLGSTRWTTFSTMTLWSCSIYASSSNAMSCCGAWWMRICYWNSWLRKYNRIGPSREMSRGKDTSVTSSRSAPKSNSPPTKSSIKSDKVSGPLWRILISEGDGADGRHKGLPSQGFRRPLPTEEPEALHSVRKRGHHKEESRVPEQHPSPHLQSLKLTSRS